MSALPRHDARLVTTARALISDGVRRRDLARELAQGRWRRAGLAVVLHNGPLSRAQRHRVAQIHAGPRAVFTAFTAAERAGLRGWERDAIHLLAPAGTRLRNGCPIPIVLHLQAPDRHAAHRPDEPLPSALVRAAASFPVPRPACGLLAASVQQRIVTDRALVTALEQAHRSRQRAQLLATMADIAGGSQALSEIDFVQLCRRHGLPPPVQQAVRRERSGRRRYLDASWRRADGRSVVAEVDGALHVAARRWWDDQLRQNEITLTNALVLRFPSVVVRTDPTVVADQLRRALRVP